MIVVNLTAGATTASTPVGLTQVLSTNYNAKLSGNTIQVQTPGIYEIIGAANLTYGAAGSFGLAIFAGSNQVGVSTTGTGEASTTTAFGAYLQAVVQVEASDSSGYASLTIQPILTPTIVNGQITVKRIG